MSARNSIDKKQAIDHVEDVAAEKEDKENVAVTDRKPESLKALSDAEYTKMEKRMVMKMDIVVMPIITILYILNYIDRQNLAAAKLQGVLEDLNMDLTQFSTAIMILFAGYIPFQIPSNLILSRITRPGLYICTAVVLWGAVSAATAAVKTYETLLVCRFFLGITEAVFFPGAIYYLSAWYTKSELGKRLAVLFIGQQLGSAFGGLIAAGVLKMDGLHGIRGWRWLFIVEGVATVGCGLLFGCVMPEYPHNARMLSQTERDLAVYRLEQEAGASEGNENVTAMQGLKMAVTDMKVYALVFCMVTTQGMGTVTSFFPTIVKTLGYDSEKTLLLTAPPYLFACVVFLGVTWYSDRTHRIYEPILCCLAIAVVSFVIAIATTNIPARYFAMMLMPAGCVCPQLFLYKSVNLHLARPAPKRAAAVAMLNSIAGTSNFWGSYLYLHPPHFYDAFGTLLALAVLYFVVITGYKFHVRKLNRQLDQGGDAVQALLDKKTVTQDQVDLGWRFVGY